MKIKNTARDQQLDLGYCQRHVEVTIDISHCLSYGSHEVKASDCYGRLDLDKTIETAVAGFIKATEGIQLPPDDNSIEDPPYLNIRLEYFGLEDSGNMLGTTICIQAGECPDNSTTIQAALARLVETVKIRFLEAINLLHLDLQ